MLSYKEYINITTILLTKAYKNCEELTFLTNLNTYLYKIVLLIKKDKQLKIKTYLCKFYFYKSDILVIFNYKTLLNNLFNFNI